MIRKKVKPRRYRVVAGPSDLPDYPIKYTAQRKTVFGWVFINWSFSLADAKDYIRIYHTQKFGKRRPVSPPTVVYEEVRL
jgi:hypothetical protein